MARDTSDDTSITSMDDLVARVASGEKPVSAFRIGTEHEKIAFYRADNSPVPYASSRGIRSILEGMRAQLGWSPIMDGEAIIGLYDEVGGGAISLEPGGQFELSGAPLETLHQTAVETADHLALVRKIASNYGVSFLGVGLSPWWDMGDTPQMPKSRYAIMTRYMPKVGTRGLDMMYRTSTIQVNLDYSSEADMIQKMRVGLALQPIATALFAASPFMDGKPTGRLSERAEIWRDTDRHRTGMLPFAFQDDFGYRAYIEWALDVPMYFVKRGDTYHDCTDITFRQYLDGALTSRLPGVVPTMGDFDNHLGTVFPEVRLKRFLEMRGADMGPASHIAALSAFWVGLMYDQQSLNDASALIADWSDDERQTLRDSVCVGGLKTRFRGGQVLEVAREAVRLAHAGLKRRAILNYDGLDETIHLAPLEAIVASGQTVADDLLAHYRGEWAENIDAVFAGSVL